MRASELLETIDNLFPGDPKRDLYKDQVHAILGASYEKTGGLIGGGLESPDAMKNLPMWKIFRTGETVHTVIMYKDKGGRKAVACGTDGTTKGKAVLSKMLKDEYLQGRSFAEVSGPMLKIMLRLLGKEEFEKHILPWERVKEILKKDFEEGTIRDINGVEFEHLIGDTWVTKVMLGTVNQFYSK